MHKYFFDVTDIALYVERETTISGIQRVSLEVIRRMVQRHGPDRVKLALWDRKAQSYVALEAGALTGMETFDADVLAQIFTGRAVRAAETVPRVLARYRTSRPKYVFHYLLTEVQAWRGNTRYFEKRGSTLEAWPRDKTQARQASAGGLKAAAPTVRRPVREILSDGDQIIIMGPTWDMPELGTHLSMLKQDHGARVSLLVHDLIPLIKPAHIAGDFSKTFHDWLLGSGEYCARYFANSENTAKDLRQFLAEKQIELPVNVVPLAQALGAEPVPPASEGSFEARLNHIKGVRRHILRMAKTPYVLVVGTMESRKNLWRLLQVWARLAQDRDMDAPRLVLAGRIGWHIEDVQDMLRATSNLQGWVSIAERPSDRELAYLYENCDFTAMVSLYEGWGLPIGEGLSFGKTGVVADNSAMPEVGQDLVEYCDAHSISSIYQACRKLISDPTHKAALEAKIAQTALRNWDDVASDFVRQLDPG